MTTKGPRFRLRVLSKELDLPPGEFTVGRSPKCDLTLDDPMISRRHFTIKVKENTAILDDLGSRNGTLVNGSPAREDHFLVHSDRIQVGNVQLIFIEEKRKLASRQTPIIEQDVKSHNGGGAERSKTGRIILIERMLDEALASKDEEQAARFLDEKIDDLERELIRGAVEDDLLETLSRYNLILASRTGELNRIDWVLEHWAHQTRAMPGSLVDLIEDVALKWPQIRLRLESYTTLLESSDDLVGRDPSVAARLREIIDETRRT